MIRVWMGGEREVREGDKTHYFLFFFSLSSLSLLKALHVGHLEERSRTP